MGTSCEPSLDDYSGVDETRLEAPVVSRNRAPTVPSGKSAAHSAAGSASMVAVPGRDRLRDSAEATEFTSLIAGPSLGGMSWKRGMSASTGPSRGVAPGMDVQL